MNPETRFRTQTVDPFLKELPNTYAMSVQQVALVGDPDKILCINGFFVALELKARGGRLSKMQKYKLDQISAAGGVALVADPDNWERVKARLREIAGA
jgi:hypothetical protein